MISGLERLKSRRAWLIRNYSVWGQAGRQVIEYLSVENVDSSGAILYGSADIEETAQEVLFGNLFDRRGNLLPVEIKGPVITVQPRGEYGAFIVGEVTNRSFCIARVSTASGPVLVDLFIEELGE
jgi:hypothetical protein